MSSVAYGNPWPYGTADLTYAGEPVRLRELIIQAIVDRFETILTAAGYYTDLGEHVVEWKTTKWQTQDLPGVAVKDLSDIPLSEQTRGSHNYLIRQLTVLIELATSGTTSVQAIRQMIADIYRAISQDETWVGLAIQTIDMGNEVAVEQEEFKVVGANIQVQVIYRTEKFQEA